MGWYIGCKGKEEDEGKRGNGQMGMSPDGMRKRRREEEKITFRQRGNEPSHFLSRSVAYNIAVLNSSIEESFTKESLPTAFRSK